MRFVSIEAIKKWQINSGIIGGAVGMCRWRARPRIDVAVARAASSHGEYTAAVTRRRKRGGGVEK